MPNSRFFADPPDRLGGFLSGTNKEEFRLLEEAQKPGIIKPTVYEWPARFGTVVLEQFKRLADEFRRREQAAGVGSFGCGAR